MLIVNILLLLNINKKASASKIDYYDEQEVTDHVNSLDYLTDTPEKNISIPWSIYTINPIIYHNATKLDSSKNELIPQAILPTYIFLNSKVEEIANLVIVDNTILLFRFVASRIPIFVNIMNKDIKKDIGYNMGNYTLSLKTITSIKKELTGIVWSSTSKNLNAYRHDNIISMKCSSAKLEDVKDPKLAHYIINKIALESVKNFGEINMNDVIKSKHALVRTKQSYCNNQLPSLPLKSNKRIIIKGDHRVLSYTTNIFYVAIPQVSHKTEVRLDNTNITMFEVIVQRKSYVGVTLFQKEFQFIDEIKSNTILPKSMIKTESYVTAIFLFEPGTHHIQISLLRVALFHLETILPAVISYECAKSRGIKHFQYDFPNYLYYWRRQRGFDAIAQIRNDSWQPLFSKRSSYLVDIPISFSTERMSTHLATSSQLSDIFADSKNLEIHIEISPPIESEFLLEACLGPHILGYEQIEKLNCIAPKYIGVEKSASYYFFHINEVVEDLFLVASAKKVFNERRIAIRINSASNNFESHSIGITMSSILSELQANKGKLNGIVAYQNDENKGKLKISLKKRAVIKLDVGYNFAEATPVITVSKVDHSKDDQ